MFPARQKSQAGFSIIDAMMATVILVVGFMGMIQAITIGSELLATAQRETLASQIINNEIEKLRHTPWSVSSGTDILTLPTGPTSLTISSRFTNDINSSGVPLANWTLSRSVSTIVSNQLRSVTFTVTWTKSGNTIAAPTLAGSALDKLAFSRNSPVRRTYTRIGVVYCGASGFNLTTQRL